MNGTDKTQLGISPRLMGALLALLVVALQLLPSGCSHGPLCGDFPLDEGVRQCMLAEIDERITRYDFFAGDKEGVDLGAVRSRLYALGDQGDLDDAEFLHQVSLVVASLRDGHVSLHYPRFFPVPMGRAWVDLLEVDGAVHVAWFPPAPGQGERSAVGALQLGDRLLLVDGEDVEDRIDRLQVQVFASTIQARRQIAVINLLNGPRSSPAVVVFEREGQVLDVALDREPIAGQPLEEPSMQRFGEVAYLKVPTFAYLDDMERVDRLLNGVMGTRGLVVDVRGNRGGFTANADLLLGRFLESGPESDFQVRNWRGSVVYRVRPRPRGRRYRQPVVVLADWATYSAANYFVHRFQYEGLGTVMGERTGGGAAARRSVQLARNVFFDYSFQVLTEPDGSHSEEGREPDVAVELTRGDLEAGLGRLDGVPAADKVLAEALHLLHEEWSGFLRHTGEGAE